MFNRNIRFLKYLCVAENSIQFNPIFSNFYGFFFFFFFNKHCNETSLLEKYWKVSLDAKILIVRFVINFKRNRDLHAPAPTTRDHRESMWAPLSSIHMHGTNWFLRWHNVKFRDFCEWRPIYFSPSLLPRGIYFRDVC